jgi:hypothetical protein
LLKPNLPSLSFPPPSTLAGREANGALVAAVLPALDARRRPVRGTAPPADAFREITLGTGMVAHLVSVPGPRRARVAAAAAAADAGALPAGGGGDGLPPGMDMERIYP